MRDGSYRTSDGLILQARFGRQFFRKANTNGAPVWLETEAGFQYARMVTHDFNGDTTSYTYVPYFRLATLPISFAGLLLGFSMQFGPRANQSIPDHIDELFLVKEW